MIDDESINIESLDLSIRFGVLEEAENKLTRLLWPSGLGSGRVKSLGLTGTANTSAKSLEWNTSLVVDDGLHVGNSFVQVHTLNWFVKRINREIKMFLGLFLTLKLFFISLFLKKKFFIIIKNK
jgi:hypothetical protein